MTPFRRRFAMRPDRLIRFVLFALAPLVMAVAPPVAAQDDTPEMRELESRSRQLTGEIAAEDAELDRLEREQAELDAVVFKRRGLIQLVADDIERAAAARRGPERTRREMAIVGFTGGDPRGEAYLEEILVLEGDDEPARRRALYQAVIDRAQEHLDAIDKELRTLAAGLGEARSARAAAQAEREATGVAHQAALDRRTALGNELDATLQRIKALKALKALTMRAPLTGLRVSEAVTRPALVAKIDNVPKARPQSGINEADIVFVELVEGGLTRLAAVFHSGAPNEIGPVRSMRTGDFDLLAQLNFPLFANSGGNRGTRQALTRSTLIDVGVNRHSKHFYRNRRRPAPHNLYTNPWNLWSVGSQHDPGRPSPIFEFRKPGDAIDGEPVRSFTIDYGATRVGYEWNGSGWARSQDGAATVDVAGVGVAPTTVIVQFVTYVRSAANAASPEAVSVGEGTAWIFTDGKRVSGRWQRPGVADTTDFVDGSGNAVPILPGRTWIELPKPNQATVTG